MLDVLGVGEGSQTEMVWTCAERGTGHTSGRLGPAGRRPGGREKRRFISYYIL